MTVNGETLVIVNPVAGAGNGGRLWPAIRLHLAKLGLVFDAVMTEAPRHATALAADALKSGCRTLICVGGDGTLHEVINGLLQRQATGIPDLTVGVIPVGTGADFVRSLGLPRTWKEACAHIVQDPTRLVDVGEITYVGQAGEEHRFFINVAGLGFDGEVASRVTYSSKHLGGTIPYFSNMVLTLVSYANKDVDVDVDDRHTAGRMNSVIVANGAWFGGGMYIAPDARPDDGFFDVVTIGDIGKLELLQTMPRVYKGTHVTHPKVWIGKARQVHVTSQQEMWIQADGECLGRAPVTFAIRPLALRLKA